MKKTLSIARCVKISILALFPFALLEIALRVAGIGGSIVYREDPSCGYRPEPDQQFSTMGHPIRILPDGFRGPPARTNILFIGDSVTYGTAYVRDEDTFPALVGGANGGVNGWGLQNMARFLASGVHSNFGTVIWVIPTCDVIRPYMTLREGLISTNRRMWFRLEYLFRFIWYGHIRTQPAPNDPACFESNVEAVLGIRDRFQRDGKRLIFVLLPSREEALGQITPETPYAKQLREKLNGAEVLEPATPENPASCYRDSAHLTPIGNRWVADAVLAHLETSP